MHSISSQFFTQSLVIQYACYILHASSYIEALVFAVHVAFCM